MAILDILDDIIIQLKNNITDLQIEMFPDKPQEYRLIHPKGAILVSFNSSDYTKLNSFDYFQQVETLQIGLILILRGVRNTDGSYAYLDKIESVLSGFEPSGCTKMYPIRKSFLIQDEGIWQHSFIFGTTKENFIA